MKKVLLLLFAVLSVSTMNGQCNTPSKFESSDYDKYHGWDMITGMTNNDSIVLNQHQSELIELLCTLRRYNKSRAYIYAIADDILELEYTKQFILDDGTLPVFKLILDTGLNKNKKAVVIFSESKLGSADNVPEEYQSYFSVPDTKVMFSEMGSSWKIVPDTLEYTVGNATIDPFSRFNCKVGNSTLSTIPRITYRYFIDSLGNCNYVDRKTDQTNKCTQHHQKNALKLYKTVEFKPAMKDGKAINSYITVQYVPWIYTPEEWRRLEERRINWENKNK